MEVTLIAAGSAMPAEAAEAPEIAAMEQGVGETPDLPRPDTPAPSAQAAPLPEVSAADTVPLEILPARSPVAPEVGTAPAMPEAPAFAADNALRFPGDPVTAQSEVPVTLVASAVMPGEPEVLPLRDEPASLPPASTRPRPRAPQMNTAPRSAAVATRRNDASPERLTASPGSSAAGKASAQTTGHATAQAGGSAAGLEREWAARVQSRIARAQRYPAGERAEGTVRVALTLGRDGSLRDVGLAGSSGNPALDRAAVEAVRRAGRFPAAPPGLRGDSFRFAVRVAFRKG